MKRKQLSGLVLLNTILLIVLAFVTLEPGAKAQSRRPGDYLVVGGQMKGETSNAIYVLDANNLEIIGLMLDKNRRQVTSAIWHDIEKDMKQGTSR
ncbi:MAG TPA: hypothetical protein ENJ06_01240 [Phycisphaeraceae bacterium]|nr:hypothetical protein [Phycisphaeraceae bacterium]